MLVTNDKNKVVANCKTQEFLSSDILEEDYVKLFQPHRLVQKALGSCRVDIKYQFVTVPTVLQKCYTVGFLISIAIATVYLMETFSKRRYLDYVMNWLWICGTSGLTVIFLISIFHARFCNNKENVHQIIKMQKVDHVMKLSNSKIKHIQFRFNFVTAIALVTTIVVLLILSFVITKVEYTLYQITMPILAFLSFIVELSSTCGSIQFFTLRVRLINGMIRNHLKTINIRVEQGRINTFYEKTAEEWQDFNTSEPDLYLKEIFRGIASFQDLHNFQILLFFMAFISWNFITMEYGILALQKNIMDHLLTDFVQLISVAIVNMFLLLALCIHAELFSRSLKTTKKLSIMITSCYLDGPLMVKATKMIDMIEENMPSFYVYGMWRLEARLLLNMFKVITSWLVALVQFAIL